MEDAILQSCQDVAQSLELHFKERKSNADFWTCKALLRHAVATHNTKIQPMMQAFNANNGNVPPVAERVNETYISLLLRIAEAALRIGDVATADSFLKRAMDIADGSPQEERVRQAMQQCAEQSKRTGARRPWG